MKEIILNHIKENDMENLKKMLGTAEEMEILYAFHNLDSNQQVIVFQLLSKNHALRVFEELDTDIQQNLLHSFTDDGIIEFINELAPDDRVRLLDELPATKAKKLINALSPKERQSTDVLMSYAPQTAGRIMTTEYVSLQKNLTVEEAIEKISEQAEEKETVYTLFVTDENNKIEGVLTLKGLLIARGVTGATIGKTDGKTLIGEIMSKNAISVSTNTDQEDVARILQELDLLAIPVIDSEQKLVGIVTIDDAVDILEEEVTEDIYDYVGLVDIKDSEADRSEILIKGSLWKIWRVRLPFLAITLAAAMFAGMLIEGVEDILESMVAVAFFIPLIMDMGGNVGTQSSTVFARGVVLGHIDVKRFLKHFVKEIGVGFSMGTLVGLIAGVIVSLWQGLPLLGLAVGLSLLATMTLAALLGFLVPFVLIRFNVDQAAGSAPIITSVKDIAGLIIYFMFVSMFLT